MNSQPIPVCISGCSVEMNSQPIPACADSVLAQSDNAVFNNISSYGSCQKYELNSREDKSKKSLEFPSLESPTKQEIKINP